MPEMKKLVIPSPNANCPGAKEYAEENYKKYIPKNCREFDGGIRNLNWDKFPSGVSRVLPAHQLLILKQ